MNNYLEINKAGQVRRRAKQIIINNPAIPQGVDATTLLFAPQVTFIMEDRILLADGTEVFMPAGDMVLPLDENTLNKIYPRIDLKTGAVDETEARFGYEILADTVKSLEDVFVAEGMERDDPLPESVSIPLETIDGFE